MKNKILCLGLVCFFFFNKAEAKSPQVKVVAIVHVPIKEVFDYIVPVSLPHIFKKYNNFPAIINTSIKSEWKTPGLERTVYFDGGAIAKEHLLTVLPPKSFSYMINGFTNSLRFLANRVEGEWQFTDLGDGNTKIEWTYKIIPKNILCRGLINLMVISNAQGYLTNALSILKDDLDSGAYKNFK